MPALHDIHLGSAAERDVQDAWTMIPRLFAIMDEDVSHTVDTFELMAALKRFADARHVEMDRRRCMDVIKSVDENHDHQMDLREFTEFITQYSKDIDIPIFDVVYFMVELMGEKQGQQKTEEVPIGKQSIFDRLMNTLKEEEVSQARAYSRFAECTAATAH